MRFVGPVLIALAMSIAAIAPVVTPTASTGMAMPKWSVGDAWTYSVTGTGAGLFPGSGHGTSTLRYNITYIATIPLGGVQVSVYNAFVNYTFVVSFGGSVLYIYFTGHVWFRTSDLAPVEYSLTTTFSGYTNTLSSTISPPVPIEWPLTFGETWNATTTVTSVSYLFGQQNSTSYNESVQEAVQANQTASLSAGSFVASVVKETVAGSAGYQLSFWSSSAGNVVSQRRYDANGTETGSTDLQSYNYQAATNQGAGNPGAGLLGLPTLAWVVAGVAATLAAVVVVILIRRRKPPAARAPIQSAIGSDLDSRPSPGPKSPPGT